MGRASSLVGVVVGGVLLAACSSGEPEVVAPPPSPTPTAAPSPTAPESVAMTHRVEAVQVNANDILSKDRGITPSREAMNEAALSGVANSLVTLLADHLDDLNLGGAGLLEDVTTTIVGVDPAIAPMLTTELASPDNPAVAADLVLRVGMDEVPQWATALLQVTRGDDSAVALELVFSTDGELELLLAGREAA